MGNGWCKKLKKIGVKILRFYYVGFKSSQFDEYQFLEDSKLLFFKICYSLYGGKIENGNDTEKEENENEEDDLYSYYTQKQQKNGQEILDQIVDVHKKMQHVVKC